MFDILDHLNYDIRAYSGRGMGNKTCLAITFECNVGKVIADVIRETDLDEREVVADAFESMKTDSIGREMIMYFPTISFKE